MKCPHCGEPVTVGAGLTKQQADLLGFIAEYIVDHGYSPSQTEMGIFMGMTGKRRVGWLLKRLKERGKITWEPKRSRSVKVVSA